MLQALIDPSRPAEAVDTILASGLGEGLDTVRSWSVGRRLDALVALRQSQGHAVECVALRCAPCQAPFEVEIDLQACRSPVVEDEVVFEVAGQSRRARLPRGGEQALWQRERTPLRLVASSLLSDGRPVGHAGDGNVGDEHATLEALGRALAQRDPLRELPVQAVCPDCGHLAEHRIDLEVHLVGALAQAQRTLLADIATLAQAYHWSEAEIAGMPAWRRAYYLQQMEAR